MRRRFLATGIALALAGCVHVPPADDGLSLEMRRDRLRQIPAWRMSGRLAIEAGDEGRMARFRWAQNGDALTLSVRGPFGAGSFEITGAPPALRVTSRGETWLLGDAESELSEWFGWWLPVASLDSWLLGAPDTDYPASSATPRGNVLESFEQRRWKVRYDEYMLAEGLLVPREIAFSHRDLAIEVTVDEWRPAAQSIAGGLN